MWEIDLLLDLELIPVTYTGGRRRPFSYTVHREDRGVLKGRGVECARRMTQMMFGEKQPLFPINALLVQSPQLIEEHSFLKELFSKPNWTRHSKRAKAARRKRKKGLKEAIELQKWLFVKDNMIDLIQPHSFVLEAVFNRV